MSRKAKKITPGKLLVDYAVYLLVRLLIAAIQALPLHVCAALAKRAGGLCWHRLRFRREVIEENLRLALPEKTAQQRDAIGLAMWEHLFLMVAEIAHAPRKVTRTTWRRFTSLLPSREILLRLVDERPMVLLSGHLGNFEMGGYLLALHGFPTYSVARTLDNPFLDRFINRFRGSTGQYMLPKKGSSGQVNEVLQRGGLIAILGDHYGGGRGHWIEFFGRPASTHKAVALLPLAAGAQTAVSAALRRDGDPLRIEFVAADIVDPQSEDFCCGSMELLIEWYTRNLERLIRQAPEQYWWVHRRWKGSPEAHRQWRRDKRKQEAA